MIPNPQPLSHRLANAVPAVHCHRSPDALLRSPQTARRCSPLQSLVAITVLTLAVPFPAMAMRLPQWFSVTTASTLATQSQAKPSAKPARPPASSATSAQTIATRKAQGNTPRQRSDGKICAALPNRQLSYPGKAAVKSVPSKQSGKLDQATAPSNPVQLVSVALPSPSGAAPTATPQPTATLPTATVGSDRPLPLNWITGFETISHLSTTLAAKIQPTGGTCAAANPYCQAMQTVAKHGFTDVVEDMGAVLLAQAMADPSPAINPRAASARVPVVMYHDILPKKKVFFDVTPEELEQHFQLIKKQGLTPISMDELVAHLKTGIPLPEKPILLTFDDGYVGHYTHVFPLLKKYNYPAVFSVFPAKVDGKVVGRSTLTWPQLQEMVASPLVTIASHSVTHFSNLTQLPDDKLKWEITESKRVLEAKLGIPIRYFTYPEGHYDQRVANLVDAAGYDAALTMSNTDEKFAGQSESVLAIARFGQSRLADVIADAWGGPPLPRWLPGFDFSTPIQQTKVTFDKIPLILLSGGRPVTIHADSRYQVPEILKGTNAVAGVDGGFFSLEFLDSNVMVGPVLSHNHATFIPGGSKDVQRIARRPLVLISANSVAFIPFDPNRHNTLAGVQASHPGVTDAFVAAAWLVKQGKPQPRASFGNLFDFDAERHRAFWGINQSGQPVVGVSTEPVDSITLGELLLKAGLRDAVMLDSGASTSLAFEGQSLVGYTPRPVPHVVALLPPNAPCLLIEPKLAQAAEGKVAQKGTVE